MDKTLAKKFYSRPEIQKAILNFAKDREISFQFETYFGKRPDAIEYISDIKTVIQKGITSFHASEERWANPMLLSSNSTEEEKNNNRIGWDLILDLDGVDFEYAKIAGKIIIEYLEKDLKIISASTKFSGNKGFHIGIPYEAMPKIVEMKQTNKLFPKLPRTISMFLMTELADKISNTILKKDGSIENISKKYNISINDLIDKKTNKLKYKKLIEIDTILIASRHLFRMPYSFNEKSGLVSIPIENSRIMNFQKGEAKPHNVDPKKYESFEFLKHDNQTDKGVSLLFLKALEHFQDEDIELEINKISRDANRVAKAQTKQSLIFEMKKDFEVFEIHEEVKEKNFPSTIQYILQNNIDDGKKRAIFVLLTFLHSINYSDEHIQKIMNNWNQQQEIPLKNNYLQTQINWFKNLEKKISPPNFNNDNYYKSIGIPIKTIQKDINKFKIKSKNPLHYIYLLEQENNLKKQNKPKKTQNKNQTKQNNEKKN